jgi:predicted enzyme related to lactoylglutathione lyase
MSAPFRRETAAAAPRLAYVNVFARDIEALSGFYASLFGFREIEGHRSPIYRCLDANGIELGFNAAKAFELLSLESRRFRDEPGAAGRGTAAAPVSVYFTVELGSRDAVEAAAIRAERLGGRVVKAPYLTYYNAVQAVLEDLEGNVFRVTHRLGARQPFAETGIHF